LAKSKHAEHPLLAIMNDLLAMREDELRTNALRKVTRTAFNKTIQSTPPTIEGIRITPPKGLKLYQ